MNEIISNKEDVFLFLTLWLLEIWPKNTFGHLVGIILVGRFSEKPFIILELGAQKGRWAMEQAFHGDF